MRFRRKRRHDELEAELAAHRAMARQDRIDRGESPGEADRNAKGEFGNDALIRQTTREMWEWQWLEHLAQDLRHSARTLSKSPSFTVAAVVALALGIGASTALFSAIEAVLLRPLPYAAPDRLVAVSRPSPRAPKGQPLTPEFEAWRDESHGFAGLAAWNDAQVNLTHAGDPEQLQAVTVNADFLQLFGIEPLLGRDFDVSQDRPGGRFVLLSYGVWQRHFGGDPDAVGRAVSLNDAPYTVVGVLPRDFRFPGEFKPELLISGGYSTPPDWNAQSMGLLHVMGRMKDGWTPEQATADLTAIEQRHAADMPAFFKPMLQSSRIQVTSLASELSVSVRRPLLILWCAVTMVLLLICANVTGLHLARASSRMGEMSLRAALGAGQLRLVRLLLCESLLVALTGGAIGVAGAFWLVRLMSVMVAQRLALPNALQVNPVVLLFAAGITAIAGLLAGLAPALAVSRPDLQRIIQGSGRGAARGWSGGLRSALVIGEVALALVLLLGAGLLLRSMQKLLAAPMGFDAERVLTMRMRLHSRRYDRPGQSQEFVRSLLERVQSLPGVRSAAVANSLPLTNYNLGRTFSFEDGAANGSSASPNDKPASAVLAVTPGYFATLGIPLIGGRGVEDSDREESVPVALVNRAFVRRYFGSSNTVGKHLRFGGGADQPWVTIVGVVGDSRHTGPEREAEPELYVPFAQSPSVPIGLAIRSSAAPELLTAAIRREIHALDPDLPIFGISTLATRLADVTDAQRVELLLVGFFAALATGLAALGVYGVIAYAVSQGTREIGVRLALGAAPGAVQRSVVGRGLRLAALGVALGLCAGYALTTSMASLLFETGTHDRLTFLGAGGILLATAVLASYWPARRAARVDPVVALRCE